MNIIETPIDQIKPYKNNIKKHPKSQIDKISKSISEFGWAQPIVIDSKNIIIVGHARFLAAQRMGLKEVPVFTLNIDESQARAYRLIDNKLNESSWEEELLIEELKSLPEFENQLNQVFDDINLNSIENALTGLDEQVSISESSKTTKCPDCGYIW